MQLSLIDLIESCSSEPVTLPAEAPVVAPELTALPPCPWCDAPSDIAWPDHPDAWQTCDGWYLTCSETLSLGTVHGCGVRLDRGVLAWSNTSPGVLSKSDVRDLTPAEAESLRALILAQWADVAAQREQAQREAEARAQAKAQRAEARKAKAAPALEPAVSPVVTRLVEIGDQSFITQHTRTVKDTRAELKQLEWDLIEGGKELRAVEATGNEELAAIHRHALQVVDRRISDLLAWLREQQAVCSDQTSPELTPSDEPAVVGPVPEERGEDADASEELGQARQGLIRVLKNSLTLSSLSGPCLYPRCSGNYQPAAAQQWVCSRTAWHKAWMHHQPGVMAYNGPMQTTYIRLADWLSGVVRQLGPEAPPDTGEPEAEPKPKKTRKPRAKRVEPIDISPEPVESSPKNRPIEPAIEPVTPMISEPAPEVSPEAPEVTAVEPVAESAARFKPLCAFCGQRMLKKQARLWACKSGEVHRFWLKQDGKQWIGVWMGPTVHTPGSGACAVPDWAKADCK